MITEKQIDAALDAYFPGEDWRSTLGDALAASRRDMRAALEAAADHSDAVSFRCVCGQAFEVRGPHHIVGRFDGSQAAHDVLAERRRQVEAEGWTAEHDDAHARGEMAQAAISYAASTLDETDEGVAHAWWPWSWEWWKPTTPRRDLVKSGALILAEIERLDRSASSAPAETSPAETGGARE